MINNINYPVSFCAKHIKTVKYKSEKSTSIPKEVSFVEINPHSEFDKNTIKRLTNEWYDATYIRDIYEDVLELGVDKPRINSKVYALTKQNKNLRILDTRQILGIAEISSINKKTHYLEFLQVDPLMKRSNIGTNILNVLKKMHNSIELNSAASALEFYIKNGFEIIDPIRLQCKWTKPKNMNMSIVKYLKFYKS